MMKYFGCKNSILSEKRKQTMLIFSVAFLLITLVFPKHLDLRCYSGLQLTERKRHGPDPGTSHQGRRVLLVPLVLMGCLTSRARHQAALVLATSLIWAVGDEAVLQDRMRLAEFLANTLHRNGFPLVRSFHLWLQALGTTTHSRLAPAAPQVCQPVPGRLVASPPTTPLTTKRTLRPPNRRQSGLQQRGNQPLQHSSRRRRQNQNLQAKRPSNP